MNDDLRDYRFYADDLKHPTSMAADYIYEIFQTMFMTSAAMEHAAGCRRAAALHQKIAHTFAVHLAGVAVAIVHCGAYRAEYGVVGGGCGPGIDGYGVDNAVGVAVKRCRGVFGQDQQHQQSHAVAGHREHNSTI